MTPGVTLVDVKELAGHRNIATTLRYSHINSERLESVIKRMSEANPVRVEKRLRLDNIQCHPVIPATSTSGGGNVTGELCDVPQHQIVN
jgi:hypothetical protein